MKTTALVIALIHFGSATILIRGPTEPVLQGETFTVECLLQDSEYNTSDVQFQIYSKHRNAWRTVREGYGFCFFSWMPVNRTENRLTLTVPAAFSSSRGFRCVVDGTNASVPERASETLNITVHYLSEPHLSRPKHSYFWFRSQFPEVLSVRTGVDVEVSCSVHSSETPNVFWYKEGSDWILPLSLLTLEKVGAMDEGQYTCFAEHPTIPSLSKKRSFNLTVLKEEDSWFKADYENVLLVTILVPVATCLLVILAVSIFCFRRAQKIRTSKGPIDDHSQKKPIYKSSTESVPVTCGGDDKQPLV